MRSLPCTGTFFWSSCGLKLPFTARQIHCLPPAHLVYHLQVASSEVAGQGVFAVQWIAKGTAIGAYPGVPRKADSMLRKASLAPNSRRYVFQSTSCIWLDPTDQAGLLSSKLGFPLLGPSCDVSMAYMNEPPLGCAVNVEIVDGADSLDLRFVTTCDIQAGTELFLDYGQSYDRSAYR